MNRRKSWKFSQGGAALFFLFLCVPFFVRFARVWAASRTRSGWEWFFLLAVVLALSVLVWFISLRPLIRQDLWRTARSWYEACFGITALYVFFALFVFVSGYTPSKYNSHPVARSAGIVYLYWAVTPFITGCVFYLQERYRNRQRR